MVAVFCSLSAGSLDIIEHACIGQDDDEERHQVQTYTEKSGYRLDFMLQPMLCMFI